jgi:hypothetical protein
VLTTLAVENYRSLRVLAGQDLLDRPAWHWPKR